ncbi:homoserine O-succinyltransferase [Lactobacillus sp. CBA3605]|uniref:homoserine O-acetyltransferase/O-succinyltransferase family protein n=1 Tax=Lactobacillus sp. CBA3605 TaxID=2099788 RepID=UPI001F43E0C4|nr:homoserine O-succinyltransferase [Lactobacillus sp. CBA3605]
MIARNGLSKTQGQWRRPKLATAATQLLILNLMPTKQATEQQFLQRLAMGPTDVAVTFMYPASHHFKGIDQATIAANYVTLAQIQAEHFDGLIVTGAPVEQLPFTAVDYWSELQTIITWAQTHVSQTLFECWAAQAGLYLQFGIDKQLVAHKIFGVYTATTVDRASPLMAGLTQPASLKMPQSRQSQLVLPAKLPAELQLVATNAQVGPLVLAAPAQHAVYVTGHPEYAAETLALEYRRDRQQHRPIQQPQHYFSDSHGTIDYSWQQASCQFYQNWVATLKLMKAGLEK